MIINTISISDPCFKHNLSLVPNPPKTIYARGNIEFKGSAVAIVGTRKPTHYGRAVTLDLAEKLAKRGITIVSGLALGIDGIAHQGALNVGGKTIAVLASGVDLITPTSHRRLAEQILSSNGGILSEYRPGTPPLAHQFLERNRLVSGLSEAVIVTEASINSGTMNTVMHALEQGRDVYAVPGNITSPTSAGCNKLIEQGATPITNISDFIDSFSPAENTVTQPLLLAQNPEEQAVLNLIQSGVSDGDELQRKSKLDATTYSTTVTMLEIRGIIRPLGANHWSL